VATDAGFVAFLADELRPHRNLSGPVTTRKMFGEYALYSGGKVVALICDNEIWLKAHDAARPVLGEVAEGFPYPGARPHLRATGFLDEPEVLARAIGALAAVLPEPRPKKPKGG
jgi:TfoX/Sxy family transcriptional regulator of competence genes